MRGPALGRRRGLAREDGGVIVLGHEPGVPEAAHRLDDRQKRLTFLGQLVINAPACAPARDDPLLVENAETLRQRAWADPRA